jgi:hypothetical protein
VPLSPQAKQQLGDNGCKGMAFSYQRKLMRLALRAGHL